MKKLLSVIFSLLAAVAVYAAGPAITFAEKSHDFGTIKADDGPVSYTFRFVNDGDEPLVIVSASADCGCTRPEYPKQPLQAGEDGAVSVTFHPEGRSGEFTKTVKVRTNVAGSRVVKLKISGVIIPQSKD